jgi:hypothetical protein
MAVRYPSPHNAAAYGAVEAGGVASISRTRSAQTARTQNEMDQARFPVLQWLCAQGHLGPEAKKTGAEIEAWRQGSAQAGARLAEARRRQLSLVNPNSAVAAALGRPAATPQDIAAARDAVVAAEDVCSQFRVSSTAVEVQQAWLALWNSPDSVWEAALDAIEGVKGAEADQARRWLTHHLIGSSELGRQGRLARTGGHWILAGR